MEKHSIILLVIIGYMLIMIGFGVYYSRKNQSVSDYVLGDRSLHPWVTAMSAQAADMSGWLLTGLPGLAYLSMAGFKEATWTAVGLAIGTFLNWTLTAKRLRSYTEIAGNALTLPEYLQNRFHDKSPALKIVTAFAIVTFFLIYTSSMFVAGAKLFATIFEINYLAALLISSVVIISYTFLGGFLAVVGTETIQGVLMFFALVTVPFVAISSIGGWDMTMLQIDPATWQIFPSGDETITWLVVISALAWGLGYFGQPHILVRFMAISHPREIKPATAVAMIWVVLTLAAAVMIGLLGNFYFATPLAEGQHETVFMVMVYQMFSPVLTGVMLSAILAAIMSTASSQLLVTSSALASDVYKGLVKKNASEKEVLRMNKLAVLVVSVVALLMGLDPNSSIFGIVSYAWAGLGASFGPIIILSLFWRRLTRRGAIAGVGVGAIGTIVFKVLKTNVGGIFAVYELLPAFVLSMVVIVIVSLLDSKPDQSIIDDFDKAVAYANSK